MTKDAPQRTGGKSGAVAQRWGWGALYHTPAPKPIWAERGEPMSIHLRRGGANARPLELLYPLPQPLDSLEDYDRVTHRDLSRLDTASLRREHYRCRHRLNCEHDPSPWLAERLAAIRAELRQRGGC